MGVSEILLAGFGALFALVILWLVIRIFRGGSRDRFITWRPFAGIAMYSFGIPLGNWAIRWATGDAEGPPLAFTVATATAFFAIGMTLWFAGFFCGRWRRERLSGVLSRTR